MSVLLVSIKVIVGFITGKILQDFCLLLPYVEGMTEAQILKMLDAALQKENVRQHVDAAILRIQQALRKKGTDLFGWEVLGMEMFETVPVDDIGSAWVFVIPAGIPPEKHRHPNSRQRTISYRGTGDLQVYENGVWVSNVLAAEGKEGRTVSIPPGAWHKPVVEQDWVVVSFHTAGSENLIEESGTEELRTRSYSD
jgi:hypothetical protein